MSEQQLPPLPEPAIETPKHIWPYHPHYTADQMREYAAAALSRLRDTQRVLVEALEWLLATRNAFTGIGELVERGVFAESEARAAAVEAARAALASVEQQEPSRQPFQLNPPPVYDQHYAATQSEVEQQEPSEDACGVQPSQAPSMAERIAAALECLEDNDNHGATVILKTALCVKATLLAGEAVRQPGLVCGRCGCADLVEDGKP